MLEHYNRHVSSNHLDIGVGTGYFLDNCTFPTTRPRLALMDLNHNGLATSKQRLKRYNPEVYLGNVLEIDNVAMPPFDSIGIMNLLHCLPGTMNTTKRNVLERIKTKLNSGGIVFGSTILSGGVKAGLPARYFMAINNQEGGHVQ